MKIIIGLGNPGMRYMWTRHNLGYAAVKKLAQESDIAFRRSGSRAWTGAGSVSGRKALLVLPATYMNLSGKAVRPLLEKFGLAPEEMLVVCDDINLELGRLRLRSKGSEGGHNGLRSVIEELGTSGFPRLRMGIRGDGFEEVRLERYVLERFDKKERPAVQDMKERASKAVRSWLRDGIDRAMSGFNS